MSLAIVSRQTIMLRILMVVLLVAADLGSKSMVIPWLEARMPQYQGVYEPEATPDLVRDHHGHLRHPLLGETLALMHNLNYGAAFGKLDSIPWVLVVGRGIAALVLLWMLLRADPAHRWYSLALILVLSGCLGNLWDNLTYVPLGGREGMPFGPVRDFIDVYFSTWDWHFPTFNIADSAISVGAVVLIFGPRPPGKKEPKHASEEFADGAAPAEMPQEEEASESGDAAGSEH